MSSLPPPPPPPPSDYVNTRIVHEKSSVQSASASAYGASILIALQFGSRALTFIVNQVLLRYLSPELLAVSTQLDVYSISVLFFARESLRVAIQRQTDEAHDDNDAATDSNKVVRVPDGHVDGRTAAGKTQTVVNLAYLSIVLGVVFAFVLAWLYLLTLHGKDPGIFEIPYFQAAVKIYGLAALLELLAEPCFVVVQQKSRFRIRAAAETSATVLRCLVTSGAAIWAAHNGREIGVLPFALGQGVYAASLAVVYYWAVSRISSVGGFFLLPHRIHSRNIPSYFMAYFSQPLLSLGASLFAQSALKHILTQGDTFLIASLASQRAQGIYALASNYGGLVARLVLQPIEESSRNYFGKLLSAVDGNPANALVVKANKSLQSLLRTYILLSLCVLAVGPTIAPLLLKFVAGSRWVTSGAGHVLAIYCYYIPLLAINGVTEAFVSSVASESEVNRQSMWMFAFSAGFVGAGYICLQVLDLGAEGLVWANALNMTFRIFWSTSFVKSYFKRHGSHFTIATLMPRALTIAAGIGTAAVFAQLESTFDGGVSDILKGGAVSLVFVALLVISERGFLLQGYSAIRGGS